MLVEERLRPLLLFYLRSIMPAALEKIKNDILKRNPNMPESEAYALATNIFKKRNGLAKLKKG